MLPTHLLPPDGAPKLAAGLRASSWASCPAKAFIEFFDPNRYFDFDPGVGQAGHDLGDLFIERVLAPTGEGVSEFVVPWEHNSSSHLDRVQLEGDLAGAWELKSTNANPRIETVSPSSTNRRQVRIQMFLVKRAGIKIPGPFRIAIIAKKDWSVHGPWTIELTDTDEAQLEAEHALIMSWMDRVESIDLDDDAELREHCQCGSCFKVERTWLEEAVALMDVKYRAIVTQPRTLSEWTAQEPDLKEIRAAVKQLMQNAEQTHCETTFYNLTLSKRGVLTVKPKTLSLAA